MEILTELMLEVQGTGFNLKILVSRKYNFVMKLIKVSWNNICESLVDEKN